MKTLRQTYNSLKKWKEESFLQIDECPFLNSHQKEMEKLEIDKKFFLDVTKLVDFYHRQ